MKNATLLKACKHIEIRNPSIFGRMHGDNLAFVIFAIALGVMPIGLLLAPILGK